MTVYTRALMAGLATGIRSMTGLTGLVLATPPSSQFPDRLLGTPWVKRVVPVLAVGESVADKLPGVPPRTAAAPFAARLVVGALCGAILARRLPPLPVKGDTAPSPTEAEGAAPLVLAALIAAGATAVTTMLGPRWRALAAEWFHSDAPGAALEDAVGTALAWQAARR
jgi:uncharacterized membrane protein